MIITSNYKKDFRRSKENSGSYEWWYFDIFDHVNALHIVVIFYDGCPFSPGDIDKWENPETRSFANPAEHPAVSISVYENGKPVFYSLTEYDKSDFCWNETDKKLNIGGSGFQFKREGNNLVYRLDLDENLPGGDTLKGSLCFRGYQTPVNLFQIPEHPEHPGKPAHEWNMSLPAAGATGEIEITSRLHPGKKFNVSGRGYHDHNLGLEPMKNEFRNWYWGRVHMNSGTLVYYIMNRKNHADNRAWFISSDNSGVEYFFDEAKLEDYRSNLFLLPAARKIILKGKNAEATIQMSEVVDSGPFYYRFISDAIIRSDDEALIETARGISEFIHPARIHNRLFRPFVNMRYLNKEKQPHWVQKNPALYRWTW
jgi:carotenoid 1,2-hydratase